MATQQTSPASKAVSTTNWFASEVQQMMYGFGDCRRPLHESAVLVEEIVHEQMASLLQQASDVAAKRCSRFIGMEDFLFLLRKDKVKLLRLLQYMEVKDLKTSALKGVDEEQESTEQVTAGEKTVQPTRKRRKICYDFLSSIDGTGELLALFDEDRVDHIKHERLVRAEVQARSMDAQQYMEFSEARQAGFSRKYKSQRFKDWLMAGVTIDIKPNVHALEVISYLAYETVAQIVDLALLVKQDMKASATDPMVLVHPPVCLNYHDVLSSPALGETKSSTGMTSPSRQPPSPPSTPSTPSTQTPPSLTPGGSLGLSSSQGSSSGGNTKLKSKKRKKSGAGNSMEMCGGQAITPNNVREALRRYGHCIGPFASQVKVNHEFQPKKRLLCA
ncbi:transcription initiation protein SPT3 homolog [Gigantopelta aegis]|uniref:transcription initiation protein SPT3 homolog n=1 Tax=Gigantopelta aegis TaxID=1735272 RepID=UPI001B88C1F3|nr:transcription initiation protein SPT3 homolog [Gigantopelta aegis]